MWMLLLASAAAQTPAQPPASIGEARTVIERQLASPPRYGPAAGFTPEDADIVMRRYLASIGKRLEPGEESRPQ